jgi:hypothetical protein
MSSLINRKQMGRIALAAALAMGALVLTSFAEMTPAPSYAGEAIRFDVPAGGRWCGPQDALGTRTCRYETFDHCLSAVSLYGTCRPNPAALLTIDDGPYRTYHSLSRIEAVTVMAD